uniref:DNA 3'-5' helicase n=1 Tax=Strongyloides stercoralis TaxID=6248 RepID=A0A0K0EA28_STRER
MKTECNQDECILPKERIKFGPFTFVKPDLNYVMPNFFCCNNSHKNGIERKHIDVRRINDENKHEISNSNNKNVNKNDFTPKEVEIHSTNKPIKNEFNLNSSSNTGIVKKKTNILTPINPNPNVPDRFKIPSLDFKRPCIVVENNVKPPVYDDFEDDFFQDIDVNEFSKSTSSSTTKINNTKESFNVKNDIENNTSLLNYQEPINSTLSKKSSAIDIDDDFYDDLDDCVFITNNSSSTNTDSNLKNQTLNDSLYMDDDIDFNNENREDMHGKFRGFLTDDGEEYLDETKHLPEPKIRDMYTVLRNKFGHQDFRHRQKAAIVASLAGKDVFILMPTGAGKSLCYQLPAAMENGVTVVISPLRALIDDQCDKMNKLGIRTEKLTSDVSMSKSNNIYDSLYDINSGIKLLYVTPEKVAAAPRLGEVLKHLQYQGRLCRFVIDEAHCVSQWGHDFRPDYTKLNTLREKFNNPQVPIMALTATATPKIVTDTKRLLGIGSSKLFISTFVRPNLKYDVVEKSAANNKKLLEDLFKKYPNGSGVLFCFSKNDCESAKELVESLGESAVIYHAGLSSKQRTEAQQSWMSGRKRVVCATIAFGMGIDKPDVRFVVHMTMAKSIEGYYQESGRAGRDGLPSHCVILYNYTDCVKLRKFVEDPIENDDGSKILKSDAVKKMQHTNINEMIAYCESVSACQRKLLVEHFGEIYDSADCKANQITCCKNCSSNKKKKYHLYEMTEIASLVLQSIQQISLTVKQISECLRGKLKNEGSAKGKKILQLPLYNKGGFLTDTDACRLVIKLITDGFAYEKIQEIQCGRNNTTFVGYVMISDDGHKFLLSNPKPKFYIHMPVAKFSLDDISNSHLMTKVDIKEAEVVKEKFKIKHKEVYQCAKFKIQSLRTQIAKEEKLMDYKKIFTDEAVDQIAALLPRTNTELLSIDNMSLYKVKKYGGRLMSTLNEFWMMVDKNDHVKMTRELDMLSSDTNHVVGADSSWRATSFKQPQSYNKSNKFSNRGRKNYGGKGGRKRNATTRSNFSDSSSTTSVCRKKRKGSSSNTDYIIRDV